CRVRAASSAEWGGKTRTSWNVRPTPRAQTPSGLTPTRLWPRSRMSPASGRERTRDTVKERGLARTVRPDQPDDLPRLDGDVDAGQRREPAEVLGDAADLEEAHPSCWGPRHCPQTPHARTRPAGESEGALALSAWTKPGARLGLAAGCLMPVAARAGLDAGAARARPRRPASRA